MPSVETIVKCFRDPPAVVAAWILRLVDTRYLPVFAAEALSVGIDSPALRALAGLSPVDGVRAGELFESAVTELGWTVPDKRSAALRYAACVSKLILLGEVAPYEGAKALSHA